MENQMIMTIVSDEVMEKTVVFFDLDKTLLKVDLEHFWIKFLLMHGLVDEQTLDTLEEFHRDYEAGVMNFYAYQRFLLKPLQTFPKRFLLDLREEFLLIIPDVLSKRMLKQLNWHSERGHEMIMITACIDFLAEPVGAMLGFEHILCTRTEQVNGAFTGQIIGTPAFRSGKVSLLLRWAAEHRLTLKGSWGYSDSVNDLPLLNLVEHPVAVAPDPFLQEHAVQNQWRIISQY